MMSNSRTFTRVISLSWFYSVKVGNSCREQNNSATPQIIRLDNIGFNCMIILNIQSVYICFMVWKYMYTIHFKFRRIKFDCGGRVIYGDEADNYVENIPEKIWTMTETRFQWRGNDTEAEPFYSEEFVYWKFRE